MTKTYEVSEMYLSAVAQTVAEALQGTEDELLSLELVALERETRDILLGGDDGRNETSDENPVQAEVSQDMEATSAPVEDA